MKPVLFVLLGFSLSVFGATRDDPSITATGEAAIRVPADRAYLVFNTLEDDNIAKSMMEQAFQDMDRVIDTIYRRNKNGIQDVRLDSTIEQATDGEFVGPLSVRVSCKPKDEVIFDIRLEPSVEGSIIFA